MQTFYEENVLNEDLYLDLFNFVTDKINTSKYVKYSKPHGRYFDFVNLPEPLNTSLLDIARDKINDKTLGVVYCQIVKYQILEGCKPSLKSHRDNLYCTHIFNITVDSTIPWPLEVEEESFPSIPNSAVFLKGDEETHGRPEYPSTSEDDYVLSIYIHLAPEGDPNLEMGKKFRSLPEESQRLFLDKMIPTISDY